MTPPYPCMLYILFVTKSCLLPHQSICQSSLPTTSAWDKGHILPTEFKLTGTLRSDPLPQLPAATFPSNLFPPNWQKNLPQTILSGCHFQLKPVSGSLLHWYWNPSFLNVDIETQALPALWLFPALTQALGQHSGGPALPAPGSPSLQCHPSSPGPGPGRSFLAVFPWGQVFLLSCPLQSPLCAALSDMTTCVFPVCSVFHGTASFTTAEAVCSPLSLTPHTCWQTHARREAHGGSTTLRTKRGCRGMAAHHELTDLHVHPGRSLYFINTKWMDAYFWGIEKLPELPKECF